MAHPLETVIRDADGLLLIGNSAEDRFPAFSYHVYTLIKKRFYCFDMGGLTESRGPTKGGKVYTKLEELPDDLGDLAIIWVLPRTAFRAVELAHEAGCRRVWFSFQTGHRDAVARAKELGMEVVEIGRCPILYLDNKSAACKAHTLAVKVSGLYGKPPRTDEAEAKRREML